jgi:hypothetical protein
MEIALTAGSLSFSTSFEFHKCLTNMLFDENIPMPTPTFSPPPPAADALIQITLYPSNSSTILEQHWRTSARSS